MREQPNCTACIYATTEQGRKVPVRPCSGTQIILNWDFFCPACQKAKKAQEGKGKQKLGGGGDGGDSSGGDGKEKKRFKVGD